MKKVFAIFLIFLSINAYTQNYSTKSKKAIECFHKALSYYNSYNYKEAIYWSGQALKKDEKFIEVYYLLSDIFGELKKYDKKIIALQKAIKVNPNTNPLAYYTLAKTELQIGRYEDAKKDFELLKKYDKENRYAAQTEYMLKKCNFGIKAVNNPVDFNPVNLGKNINSEFDEYLPGITADEKTLIFTRLIPSGKISFSGEYEKQEDFFMSEKENGIFMPAKPFGYPLNTKGNEGALSISADGEMLFFTSCEYEKGKSAHGKTYGSCDIFVSYKEGNTWSKPKNLGPPVNTKYWESQPSFSADGKTLYFASNRPGGKGKIDIWKTEITENGKWTTPVNLGDSINTTGQDQSPFIHYDGKTLYFSSNGHLGMGKSDLFLSRKNEKGQWKKPKNLGFPINTFDEEVSLIVNARGNKAYFASSKKSEFGGIDLYSFEITKENRPSQVTYVEGKVFDKKTADPVEAEIKLINVKTNIEIARTYSDKITGKYLVCLPAGEEYAFTVSQSGYLFYSENFNLKKHKDSLKTYKFDIALSPVKKGGKIILKNVFFDTDSYKLKKESYADLHKLLDFMKENPEIKIEIGGHTDNVGNEEHNKQLSVNRAKSVYNFLVSKGISKNRITYEGYGSSQPVDDNKTEKGRQNNRRTEVKIL